MWRRAVPLAVLMLGATAASASAEPAVGVIASPGNALVTFDTGAPGTYTAVRPITGLQPRERIAGIDYRYTPMGTDAKALYGVGIVDGGATDMARVYTIDPGTGAATQVGTAPVPLTGGDDYGVDFNHTVDRIRVVDDGEENARLNPSTGGRADAPANDTDLAPAGQMVSAIAYDRVDADPATPTTLFGISKATRALVTIGGRDASPSPNLGAVLPVGPLGTDPFESSAFDISPTGAAYAALDDGLYTVDLATGAAKSAGRLPTGLRGLAIVPAAAPGPVTPPPGGGYPPPADRTAPKAKLTVARSISRAKLALRGMVVQAKLNEAARLRISIQAAGRTLATKTLGLAGGKRTATLRPSRRALNRQRAGFKMRVTVTATDAAGNRSMTAKTVTVKR
jgi:Domain of unknown function (DUF4394)